MLFNSIDFILFFPLVVLVYYVLPKKVRNYWLLVASYYFYMCWNPKYILLLMGSTLVTFLSGLGIEAVKNSQKDEAAKVKLKNGVVAISFILNIGLLFYFKYTNFAIDVLTRVVGKFGITLDIPVFDIVLPVGISFYIFQALSYTVDVYRDEIYAEKNIFRYALFVSFFPQLVAGPIERSKNLLKQLATPSSFDYENVRGGLLTMLWGYFLKLVIADRVALLVNTVYGDIWSYSGIQLVMANAGFALQIYCDFMGYSIIAIGAARVLGYNLMSNFEMPYMATSIKDFWRRWHISLSSWLRDYLYIPLGGNRKGRLRKYFNIIVTFFVSGLWHGANFTFIAWGLLHGIYQIIEDIFAKPVNYILDKLKVNRENFGWRAINAIKTFILADIAWVFFRADHIGDAFWILKNSLKLSNANILLTDKIYELGLDTRNFNFLMIGIVVLFISSIMREKKIVLHDWVQSQNTIFRYLMYWAAVTMIIFSLDLTGQEFIYFQF